MYTEKGILALRNILAEGLNNAVVSPAILGDIESPSEGMILEFAPSDMTDTQKSVMDQVIRARMKYHGRVD